MNEEKKDNDEQATVPSKRASAIEANILVQPWLKRAGLITLGITGSLTLLLGAASYPLSGFLIRPRLKRLSHLNRPHLKALIRRMGIEFEDIEICSFDDTMLHGWWMQAAPDAPTVVVLHGVNNNRTSVLRAALTLRRAGFNVLVFDGRAHGNSGGRYVTYGFYERRDVETAINWLISEKKVDKNCIGLAGESMGAAISLQVAADLPWIRAVWADSPFASLRRIAIEYVRRVTRLPEALVNPVMWTTLQVASYRGKFDVNLVDPLALASKIKCPVFLVHGTEDQLIETAHSQNIYDALGGKKDIWFVEGAAHARSAQFAKREYGNLLIKFFTERLEK